MATETEFMLMIDYQGVDGVFGSESRRLPYGTTEASALKDARMMIREHARRVEVWTREVPVEWLKVEELNR